LPYFISIGALLADSELFGTVEKVLFVASAHIAKRYGKYRYSISPH